MGMTIQLELWQLILLLLAFFGFVAGAGKVLLGQIDKRLDSRFDSMEKARKESFDSMERARSEAQQHWDRRFNELAEQNRIEVQGWKQLERDFLGWKAELPIQYVRREDYIRGQSVIEAKLDSLASKLELAQIRGSKQ